MTGIRRRVLGWVWIGMILLAGVVCGMWLGSGREILTKSSRAVEIEVYDDVFGDSLPRTELVRGPIWGYYIGLDAVAATASLFLLFVITIVVIRRTRGPRHERYEKIDNASENPPLALEPAEPHI